MKTKTLLLLCFIFTSVGMLAQKKIVYDFNSKLFTPTELKSNDSVEIYVKNVNPFYYNVNHEESIITKNPLPEKFFNILSGDVLANIATFSQKTENNKNLSFDIISSTKQNSTNVPCVDVSVVSNLNENYKTLSNISKSYKNLLFEIKSPYLNYSSLSTSLQIIKDEVTKTNDSIIINSNKPLLVSYHLLKKKYIAILLEIEKENCVESNRWKLVQEIIKPIITDETLTTLYSLENLYRNSIQLEKDNRNNKAILKLLSKHNNIKGDTFNVSLDIKPREQMLALENHESGVNISKKFPIKNYFKASFSSGLFISSGINDRNYSVLTTKVNDTTNVYSIIREDESKVNYGLNALTQFTWNMKKGALGFNAGFGYLPKNSKLTGLLGITSMFGKEQKIIISLGLSATFIKTLSDSLELGKEYSTSPEIKTKEIFKTGSWLGLAYRL